MIIFALGVLLGAGCLAVYNEMYTRWLYADVKRRAAENGITQQQLKMALMREVYTEMDTELK